jgi:hypothetical protein
MKVIFHDLTPTSAFQTLLKHTSSSHPDHSYLVSAQRAIHDLAMTINCRERESCEAEQNLQHLRELENLLDGCGRLAVPDRNFLRCANKVHSKYISSFGLLKN